MKTCWGYRIHICGVDLRILHYVFLFLTKKFFDKPKLKLTFKVWGKNFKSWNYMWLTSSVVSKYFLFYGFLFDKNKTTLGLFLSSLKILFLREILWKLNLCSIIILIWVFNLFKNNFCQFHFTSSVVFLYISVWSIRYATVKKICEKFSSASAVFFKLWQTRLRQVRVLYFAKESPLLKCYMGTVWSKMKKRYNFGRHNCTVT